uniref:F-box/kelch-repeat protein At3g06240-like n=1 Tax=Erigeron canadensis TaxID=72917 RepID=UPI001CB9B45A|nr:F-box/kelch-repeat protein At3g06240-like [Erigeron canadensis]
MAEVVGDDIIEQILARSDVDDLMRYKCICKSWLSLISNPVFIKKHLSLSHRKDRNNNLSRRIAMFWLPFGCFSPLHKLSVNNPNYILTVGSVNGLVCLITPDVKHIFIDNPSIRNVIKQHLPQHIVCDVSVLCAGFGYDSLTDDYKVILGSEMKNDDNSFCICFNLLSLKANVWKVIQLHHYKSYSKFGVFCNGALHWFMKDCNNKAVIVSFDLSKEEFKETPQPDDRHYEWKHYHQLGIMNRCLSIYNPGIVKGNNVWIMNNYDDKRPNWEMLPRDCAANCQVVHVLCPPKNYMEYGLEYHNISCESDKSFRQSSLNFYTHEYICSLLFVQSLVSPHMFKANNEWE